MLAIVVMLSVKKEDPQKKIKWLFEIEKYLKEVGAIYPSDG